jgi:DNA/RNA-binding domain of Phe-tRNA-synthetase-like protein
VSLRVEVAPELAAIVAPAALTFDGLVVIERDDRMDGPIAASAAALIGSAGLEPVIAAVRAMYKRLGIDPTKTRPSSEALLRRLRRGEGLPRINSLVDICNWCSVETQLPFGLYDRARVEGEIVTLRRGHEGEGYDGIRKDRVNVSGRMTLADRLGAFGNPTSDSARTMVTLETTKVLFVIYAPVDVDERMRQHAAELTSARVAAYASMARAAEGSAG